MKKTPLQSIFFHNFKDSNLKKKQKKQTNPRFLKRNTDYAIWTTGNKK